MNAVTRLVMPVLLAGVGGAQAAAPGSDKPPVAPPPRQLHFDRRSPVVAAVERVKNAVVNISSTRLVKVRGFFNDEMFERFFGGADPFARTFESTHLGSGVVIHPAGYVLTNAHVVARATTITCSFSKDAEFKARLVSSDPAHDLAILKIDSPKPLPHVPMGRSDDLMIGETVIAIGNPLGYSHTVTTGVVSAVGREIKLSDELTLTRLIQTDASINPGNSGGPLLNINGELIGINTAIRGDAQNIGFAIPIDQARGDLAFLLDFARVNDLLFGATLADGAGGPTVATVEAGSPASEGGLAVGDRVVAVDDSGVGSLLEFNVTMLGKGAGQICKFKVARSGKAAPITANVQLVRAPRPDGNALLWERFEMRARPVDKDLAVKFHLQPGVGMVVTQMGEGSQASKVGLRVGDVLVQIDKQATNSADDIGLALKEVRAGQSVRMTFLRGYYQISLGLRAN